MTLAINVLQEGQLTIPEAFQIFDGLSPINTDFMLGRWKGRELITGHPMDGILELSGWYGKYFIDENNVHPLLFYKNKTQLFSVNPKHIPLGLMSLNLPKTTVFASIVRFTRPLFQTKQSKARLRVVEYRGLSSATMCYDEIPINDCFRQLDDNTVLGVMDQKGGVAPYFFILERDDHSPFTLLL